MGSQKDIYLSFFAEAKSSASIRKDGETHGTGESAFKTYNSEKLFKVSDAMEFRLGLPSDEDLEGKFRLSISGHHMKNEANGEYYHNTIDMLITKKDLANIAKYSQFLIDAHLEDEE